MELPHHIIDIIERRWKAKLEEDARLWRQKRGLSSATPLRRNAWEAVCDLRGVTAVPAKLARSSLQSGD
jgi:hypothetical protein